MAENVKITRGSGKAVRSHAARLNDLLRGKIDKFSFDALVNVLTHTGMRVEIKVKNAA